MSQQQELVVAYWGNFEEYHQLLPKELCRLAGSRSNPYWTPLIHLEHILEENRLEPWKNHELYEYMVDPASAIAISMAKLLKGVHSFTESDSFYTLKELLALVPTAVPRHPLFAQKHLVTEAFKKEVQSWLPQRERIIITHRNLQWLEVKPAVV